MSITLNDIGIILFLMVLMIAIAFLAVTLRNYANLKLRLEEESLRPEYARDRSIQDLDYFDASKSRALLDRIDRIGEGLLADGPDSTKKLQLKLIRAGFFSESAPKYYRLIAIASMIVMPFLAVLVARTGSDPFSTLNTGLLAFVGFAGGYYGPELFIRFRTDELKKQCRRGFPDLLDLLVVASEAGLSLEAALSRVGDEIARPYPFLGQNIHLLIIEMRLGQSLNAALASFMERVDIPAVRNFVIVLQQSREFGTSISDTLRIFSEDMRDQRQMYAEEKAMELPVKLIFPLALFMLPCVFIVAMLPIYVLVSSVLN